MFPFPSVLGGELRDSIKSPFKQQTSVDGIQLGAEAKDSTEAGDLAQLEMATMTGTGTSASQQSFSDSESYDENESDSSQSRNKPQRVARWSKFVRNLYEMTMDPKNEQAVGFSGDGLCLELRDGKHLSNDVLHKYFKHRNVSSFIRQLNNYGFKTVPIVMNSALSHCFAHDCFQKGRTDLLVGVVRRSGANDPAKVSAESTEKLKRKTLEYEQKMSQLLRMTEDLRQQNQDLQEENKRLKAAWLQSQEALRYKMFEQQQQQQSQQHHQLLQHQSSQVMSHQQASSQHMPQQLHTSTVQLGGVPIIQRRLTTAPIHPSQTQQPEPFLQYPNVPDPGDNFFFLNNQGFFGDE